MFVKVSFVDTGSLEVVRIHSENAHSTDAYLVPNRTSTMEFFAKIVNYLCKKAPS